ncbi:MAG: cell envelope integrity EipB family protein [Rhizobiales bacterium]|nr:cell envelope integrity EipB family protein [Hyphomicrobiales bacterium]
MRRLYRFLLPPSDIARVAGGVLAGALLLSVASAQAATIPFLPHQASYDLSLLKSRNGAAAVDSARGRILYNFTGSACEGYTSEFRQVSELNGSEGKSTLSDLRSTSWEDADGKTYRFKIDTRMNEGNASDVDGIAERTGDHVTVKLKQPAAKTFTLDGSTVFPTQQVRRIIAAAREGKSLLELTVYDGSDNGEKVYNTLTVIGKPIPGDKVTTPDPSTSNDAMKTLTRWPVTVSYYDRDAKSNAGEQTPTYAMSFELYENGVSRALKLDYNDFVIGGTLDKFEVKSSKPCKTGEK